MDGQSLSPYAESFEYSVQRATNNFGLNQNAMQYVICPVPQVLYPESKYLVGVPLTPCPHHPPVLASGTNSAHEISAPDSNENGCRPDMTECVDVPTTETDDASNLEIKSVESSLTNLKLDADSREKGANSSIEKSNNTSKPSNTEEDRVKVMHRNETAIHSASLTEVNKENKFREHLNFNILENNQRPRVTYNSFNRSKSNNYICPESNNIKAMSNSDPVRKSTKTYANLKGPKLQQRNRYSNGYSNPDLYSPINWRDPRNQPTLRRPDFYNFPRQVGNRQFNFPNHFVHKQTGMVGNSRELYPEGNFASTFPGKFGCSQSFYRRSYSNRPLANRKNF